MSSMMGWVNRVKADENLDKTTFLGQDRNRNWIARFQSKEISPVFKEIEYTKAYTYY